MVNMGALNEAEINTSLKCVGTNKATQASLVVWMVNMGALNEAEINTSLKGVGTKKAIKTVLELIRSHVDWWQTIQKMPTKNMAPNQ